MCESPSQGETDAGRAAREKRPEPDRTPVWEKTRPRGNQPVDRRDLDRGLERLETLVGH